MPETSGIHEIINPGGSGSSFSPTYSKLGSKTTQKKSKLKIGEIVPGKVIEVQLPDIAVVSLPEGIFSAALHSNLQKDDYLYFKVTETDPSLVLKIYSVPSKYEGKNISVENILRILFLPNNIFFSQLISFLKNVRKNIVRDEIIKINQFYSNLSDNYRNYSSLQNSFRLIIFLIDNKLQLTQTNYQFFAPVFMNEEIPKIMKTLDATIYQSNDKIFDELKSIFNLIKKPDKNFYTLFKLFNYSTNESEQKDSFYNTLTNLIQKIENNEQHEETKDALISLIGFIDSLHIFNLIKFKNKKPITIIIPYYYKGRFNLARIQTQKKFKPNIEKAELSIETKNFDDIAFNFLKFEDIYEIQIKNKSKKFENIIIEFINSLSDSLENNKLKLGLVKMVEEFEDPDNAGESEEQKNQVISVVI
jgi:hypothetical protein